MNLKQFCSDSDDIGYYLHEPWSMGDYTYATNGHIIVRVARVPEVPENEKAPNAAKLFDNAGTPTKWFPVPEATMLPDIDCEGCDGTGTATCNLGHKHDCEDCDSTGIIKQKIGQRVNGISFDQRYLSMIQGWEIAPNGKDAAWIRNGDIDGLLMPRHE